MENSKRRTRRPVPIPFPGDKRTLLRYTKMVLEEQGIDLSPDDLKSLEASILHGELGRYPPSPLFTARHNAEGYVWQALHCGSREEARRSILRALELDPENPDAQIILSDIDGLRGEQRLAVLRRAAACGEHRLGDAFIRQNVGRFWSLIETRPYMRALGALAFQLRDQKQFAESSAIFGRMIELNPADSQGIRYPLLGVYLRADKLDHAARLLQFFHTDANPSMVWGRTLLLLLQGDENGAKAELAKARQLNKYVELGFLCILDIPKGLAEDPAPGSIVEAFYVMDSVGVAWEEHAEAFRWFKEQVGSANVKRLLKTELAPGERAQ